MGKSEAYGEVIGVSTIGLVRGSRGGMFGEITKGTWEPLGVWYVKGVGEVRSSV